jgi:CheY-like chemotaxis protein
MRAEALARPRPLPPVLAVTAHAMAEEAARYRAAGFAAHLTKPLRRAVLRDEVLAVLERATPRPSAPAAAPPQS